MEVKLQFQDKFYYIIDHNKCPSSEKSDEKCILRKPNFHQILPKYAALIAIKTLRNAFNKENEQFVKQSLHVCWGQKRTNVLHLNEIFSFLAAGATLDPAIISKADNLQTNLSSRAEED